ncbi:transmembrane protein 268 isoform X1 [Sylvia atricapilla]|uniref:transmembrane protein 268 isoform X1 n=1 Tax=Sylvia atricapilla TaxID=48155 RepID=UPI00339367F9
MAQKSQAEGTERNESSLQYCKSELKEGALQWVTDPPQGRLLLVLSVDNTCPTSSFDMDLCARKLQALGVQVPMDAWKRLIQEAVLRPEVRRFLFYSSRGFQIAMAVVFYISLWTNLYSTLQLCSLGHSWGAAVLVTLVALALTVLVILVMDCQQRKLNVNTDVRLAAVNEIFIKHSIILGITDVLEWPHNILQLCFVHFSPEPCLQALTAHITHLQGTQAMAQQLLVIFSGCYVRLLVTGRLPGARAGGHLGHSSVPCLCQFIQTTVLHTHHSWGRRPERAGGHQNRAVPTHR